MKLLTTSTALALLGPDYQFSTKYYLGADTKNLEIKGGGDPRFTEESLWADARELSRRGVTSVEDIYLDDSAFKDELAVRGERAYASPASALAFNFNAIGVLTCPAKVGQSAILAALPQEATISLQGNVKTRAGSGSEIQLSGNDYTLNLSGSIGADQSCVALYRSVSDPKQYLTKVIGSIFRQAGLKVNGQIKAKTVDSDAELIYEHKSPPLSYIIRDLNHLSTNFVAEQIVFALGQDAGVQNFSHARGLKQIEAFLRSQQIPLEGVALVDGSGLSHENRLTAQVLAQLLFHQQSVFNGGVDLLASLPISGVSGTVEKRHFGAKSALVRAKTGSLDGVSALAGFAHTQHSGDLIFVILQNGVTSREAGQTLEERLVSEILTW